MYKRNNADAPLHQEHDYYLGNSRPCIFYVKGSGEGLTLMAVCACVGDPDGAHQ